MGIIGNELADQAAKSATENTHVDIPFVPSSDVKASLKRLIFRAWQTEWHNTTFKLSVIKDTVNPWRSSSRPSRREEVILTRLRIGHCHFSHGFILRNETPPICDSCKTVLSVEHVLLHCLRFDGSRRRHALGKSLREVLGDDDSALSKLFLFFERMRNIQFYDIGTCFTGPKFCFIVCLIILCIIVVFLFKAYMFF